MQSTSKVIMGATLVMVVSLAIILGLVLVLLAELYCSLLLRHRSSRQLQIPPPSTASTSAPGTSTVTNTSTPPSNQPKSPLASFYSQGVLLHAPRNILFPMISPQPSENNVGDSPKIHQSTDIESQEHSTIKDKLACSDDQYHDEQNNFVYISNPIYDNSTSRPINDGEDSAATTPFQTPNSSPSGLLESGSHCSFSPSCSGEDVLEGSSPSLSPMKKLPAEACSVSLGISAGASDSHSVNNDAILSSSSSTSPCTSPSW